MSAQEHNLSSYNGTPWYVHDCTIEINENHIQITLFLLYLFIFMAGLLENLLVLWVNWRRRHSANGVLFCVLNITLSDTMMIVVMPFFMMEMTIKYVWVWGWFLCKVTNLVYVVNFYSSSFFLMLMTLERYLSLTRPAFPALFPTVGRRRWFLCGGVWMLSFFLALLENVHVELLEWDEPGCHMWPEHNEIEWYGTLVFLNCLFQFLFPCTVIITCNILISRAVRAAPDVQDQKHVWLVHVYSLVFVLCWLPYHLVNVILLIDYMMDFIRTCNVAIVLYGLYDIVEVLSLFHCVANPILYNFLSKSFRRNLINTVLTYINKKGNVVQTRASAQPNGGDARTSQSDADS